MCGIAGLMNLNRTDCSVENAGMLVKKMTDIIAHRGPDGEGCEVLDDGHVYMGHRRLAVIDLSERARQPMHSLDKRFTITYNGEVYNYRELRRQLKAKGFRFFSDSDTEVVLNAYIAWGVEAFEKLNGVFAFGIWDNCRKQLVLVRDRYGARPLYYSKVGNQLVFASEYKAILEHPQFRREVNLESLKEYFTFQNIFSNNSLLRNVQLLESGSYLKVDYSMEELPEPKIYWEYNFYEDTDIRAKEEYEEELNRLFQNAVMRQLVSDVSIGSYLSGGIDSGSITAIASKKISDLKTFTCGFDLHSASGIELAFDEREKAEYMSYLFKTEHYEMVLKSGDMERCMRNLVWHIEDPRVGQSYPNYYAAKLASQFVKVVLAGTGGDEIFAGYPWRYYRAANCKDYDEYVKNYYCYWQRLLSEKEQEDIFSPIYEKTRNYSTESIFRGIFERVSHKENTLEQNINNALYLEARTFLNGLLIIEDKISMAFGLESRVPFLDNDLVDFAMKIPVKYKLSNLDKVVLVNENNAGNKKQFYWQKSNDGKTILRNVMEKYVPKEITRDVKQGFSAPDASWFRGESIAYVKSIVDNPNSRIYEYMDKKAVQAAVSGHMSGKTNRRLFIWSLLNFETWLHLYA